METTGLWQHFTKNIQHLTGNSNRTEEPESSSTFALDEKPKENIQEDPATIAQTLMHAVDSRSEVQVCFGSKILIYRSRFLPEVESGAGGSGELSSEYLRNMDYLLIGPTDPPEGYYKFLHGRAATLFFVYGGKINQFVSSLWNGFSTREMSVATNVQKTASSYAPARPETALSAATDSLDGSAVMSSLKLIFPERIFRKAQQRDSVRIKYHEDARVLLTITRAAGYDFFAKIVDLSTGGVRFELPSDEPFIAEKSEVSTTFSWAEEMAVTTRGTVVKIMLRKGKPVGQIIFAADSYEVIRDIGKLVTHIERVHLRNRHPLTETPISIQAEHFAHNTPQGGLPH
ncbi:PilZ domain-containing protein [Candidatus Magnetaquicoccus inordinatus]|uniref:PilZ domain-containing protein n=1 Tax=Candidatus Magnetaquicoccus inordinatus TaxID=2496818 RepID=UPI00102C4B6E|nr:PilZ domain-containing protein [Candidatus Magnetaquicoccus inordinatus]